MWTNLVTPAGDLPVWQAVPETPPAGGIVLIHEAFRVTNHIRGMCSFFAGHGYHVLAPDMLAHTAPARDELPINKHGLEEARRLIQNVPWETYLHYLQACVDSLAAQNLKVALLGYCFGGSMAYYGGTHLKNVAAVDSYYGGMLKDLTAAGQPACPTQIHLATMDRYIPLEETKAALASHHPQAQVYVYEADHAFNRHDGITYDDAAAALARKRSLAFLARHLTA